MCKNSRQSKFRLSLEWYYYYSVSLLIVGLSNLLIFFNLSPSYIFPSNLIILLPMYIKVFPDLMNDEFRNEFNKSGVFNKYFLDLVWPVGNRYTRCHRVSLLILSVFAWMSIFLVLFLNIKDLMTS